MPNRIAQPLRTAQAFALYVCVFSLPLQGLALVPGTTFTLTKVFGGALVVLVVVERMASRQFPFPRIGIESATLLALLAGAMACVAAPARGESLRALLVYAQYAAICYAGAHVAMREETQARIAWLLGAGGALSGAGALAARFNLGLTPTVDTLVPGSQIRRVCFGLPDSNEQAMLLVFALALFLFVQRPRQRELFALRIVLLALVYAGLLLTMSRTGWACALLVSVLWAVAHPRRKWVIAVALVGIVTATLATIALRPGILDSVTRRITETTNTGDRSIASRVVYDTKAIATALRGGPFGYGLGSVDRVTNDFTDPLGRRVGVTVHNVPLTVWIEMGWVGLAAFLWLWSCVLVTLVWTWKREQNLELRQRLGGYCAVALSYALISQTMPFLQRSSLPVLLGCALGAAALSVNTQKECKRSHNQT